MQTHTLAHKQQQIQNIHKDLSSFLPQFQQSSLIQLVKNVILFTDSQITCNTHTHIPKDSHSISKLSLSHVVGAKKEVFIAVACVSVCVCVFGQWKDHETHLRHMSESDKPLLISMRSSFKKRERG